MVKRKGKKRSGFADISASTQNYTLYNPIFLKRENPYLSFLLQNQHPFFLIHPSSERTNSGETETAFIFTYLHSLDSKLKLLDIVFENVNEGRATLIFSAYFHSIRHNYIHVIQFLKSYFTSTDFNKRLKLMRAEGISNIAPQFNLTLQRVAHDEYSVWSSIMKRKLHLHLQSSFGCLAPYLVNGQKLGKKWQTKENEDEQTTIQPFRYRF